MAEILYVYTDSFTNQAMDAIKKAKKMFALLEEESDIVITGEGRLDQQTAMGKAPIGVAKIAKTYNKKVLAFAGCVTEDADLCNQEGIDAYFPILRNVITLDEALRCETAENNVVKTVEQVFRVIKAFE